MSTRSPTLRFDYMSRTCVREPDWLAPVRAAGEARAPGMQLSPYEGQLLHWLVSISGAQHILEIGSFMGYSTLWMAHALPDDGTVTSLEARQEHAELARTHAAHSPYADRVTIHHADGLAWLQNCTPHIPYDFMFIDAEKRRYPEYLRAAMPLLAPRAWVVADNTFLFGALTHEAPDAASPEAIRAMHEMNALLCDPTQFEGIMLPTSEGLTVARRVG